MLNNFKWYRKLRGGIWYKYQREVCGFDDFSGEVQPITLIYWSRNINVSWLLLEVENYTEKNYFYDKNFCEICNKNTLQKIEHCKHERDCNERIECLECGSHKYGVLGE